MKKIESWICQLLDSWTARLNVREANEDLRRYVWHFTGFGGEDADNIVRLLIEWHYVSKSRDCQRRLAQYGIKVSVGEEV